MKTISELDILKNKLIAKVDILIAKKKKLYSNIDISEPMCQNEKDLNNEISNIFSEIQTIIKQKRTLN